MRGLYFIGLMACMSMTFADVKPDEQGRDARMRWWREARFGMFIHWGLYAVPAGVYNGQRHERYSEWIMAGLDIPVNEYEQFAKEFNPVLFDAEQWVRIAAEAGVKYIVITSKHHDGFSMFDTKHSDYNIVQATPYGKDPLAALSKACRKAGIPFGIYYSQLDWHHKSQHKNPERTGRGSYAMNVMRPEKKEQYIRYMREQLRELIEQYDPAILWFDGEWTDWWMEEDARALEKFLKEFNPWLVINNRIGKRAIYQKPPWEQSYGDFGTPEQEIPDTGLDYDWETCMTINGSWGYDKKDHDWKDAETLLGNLVDIVSKGGNYLLNIGPTDEGVIPEPSVERLREMGQWLSVHGQAVYGTSASPFERPEWGRYTTRDNYLYAHVFDWPSDRKIHVPSSSGTLRAAALFTGEGPAPLEFHITETEITVLLPDKAPFETISVVALEFDSPL